MTGSFLTSWMMFFYPEEHTLKIVWWYLKWKCVRMRESRKGVLGKCWGHLTRDMDNRFIPDVLKDIFYPNECTLKFLCWYLYWRCIRKGGQKGGTWRTLSDPDQRYGWQGHSWRLEWCSFTLRNIPWKFCVNISIRSVSRRGVKKGVTWRMLRVPDRWLGWQGHSWSHE